MLCFWACRRILITSIGVTIATASVTPAANPAMENILACFLTRRVSHLWYSGKSCPRRKECSMNGKHEPKNIAWLLTTPVCLSASNFLYCSKLVNRIAILGTIPVTTAPNPLYKPNGDSFFTIEAPVAMKPRFGVPGALERTDSCIRTFMVSRLLLDYYSRCL